jgi:hypothetical protein
MKLIIYSVYKKDSTRRIQSALLRGAEKISKPPRPPTATRCVGGVGPKWRSLSDKKDVG